MAGNGMWIKNALLVLPQQAVRGHIYIKNGLIAEIALQPNAVQAESSDQVMDAQGWMLLPGLIDLHCDAIEKEVEPRPNTLFPMELALVEMEKKLAAAGITTMYHSLSLGVGLSLRGDHLLEQLIQQIRDYAAQQTMIRHRIHLRYEITHFAGMALAEQLIQSEMIDLFSFMNHAPGIGQYKRPGSFAKYVMKNQGIDQQEAEEIVTEVLQKQAEIDWQALQQLTRLVRAKGLRIASHDDDSIEQVNQSMALGATISEFPLNMETAAYARQNNLGSCVGAPNIIRGGSHDHNLRAMDAVKAGAANILCSDYSPASLLHAVFKLTEEGISLSEAVNMATLHPAQALGIEDELGSIEAGKRADLLLVEPINSYPSIRKTIVDGTIVYESYFRSHRIP